MRLVPVGHAPLYVGQSVAISNRLFHVGSTHSCVAEVVHRGLAGCAAVSVWEIRQRDHLDAVESSIARAVSPRLGSSWPHSPWWWSQRGPDSVTPLADYARVGCGGTHEQRGVYLISCEASAWTSSCDAMWVELSAAASALQSCMSDVDQRGGGR